MKELRKGSGHDMEDYGTEIPLIEFFDFKKRSNVETPKISQI